MPFQTILKETYWAERKYFLKFLAYIYPCVYLYAGLPKVDAESVGVPGVVLHQLLQGSERGTPRDKESTLV